jgi:hypothetical protein
MPHPSFCDGWVMGLTGSGDFQYRKLGFLQLVDPEFAGSHP